MNAKHTPAPWANDAEEAPAGTRIAIAREDGTQIAEVLNFDDFPCLDQDDDVEEKCKFVDDEARANAALITAAPRMLDRLKTIRAGMNCICKLLPFVGKAAPCEVCELDALIADAEVRS